MDEDNGTGRMAWGAATVMLILIYIAGAVYQSTDFSRREQGLMEQFAVLESRRQELTQKMIDIQSTQVMLQAQLERETDSLRRTELMMQLSDATKAQEAQALLDAQAEQVRIAAEQAAQLQAQQLEQARLEALRRQQELAAKVAVTVKPRTRAS